MTPSARQGKRKEREPKSLQFYEKEEKYQHFISEFEIRCTSDKSAKVWRYFGDLCHNDNIVCERVYCSPCFENQKKDNPAILLGSVMHKIKHYARSVSTGNLAIHLNDKHNIAVTVGSGNSSSSRPAKSRSRIQRTLEADNTIMEIEESATQMSSSFANIDSSDEFEEDRDPTEIARQIQKLAIDILSQISATESLSYLIHQFRCLLRLSRSNYRELRKCKPATEERHHYLLSMHLLWNLIKSVIVLWESMPDHSLSAYLEAIQYVYKTVPVDFKEDTELELLGHVLILISGSVKCCDQSTLVLFAETIE